MEKIQKQATVADVAKTLNAAIDELKFAVQRAKDSGAKSVRDIAPAILQEIATLLAEAMYLFEDYDNTLTPSDRSRLIGAGIKNLGFVQAALNSAQANPTLLPGYLSINDFEIVVLNYMQKRALLTAAEQFAKIISDSMLTDSDTAFHDALEYYNYVKEAARQRIPGAETAYNQLRVYFRHGRPISSDEEPTIPEVERDVRALLHGSKEGRVVVENVHPVVSGGERIVSDTAHTLHAGFKETIDGNESK